MTPNDKASFSQLDRYGAIDEYQLHSITPHTHAHWPCLAPCFPSRTRTPAHPDARMTPNDKASFSQLDRYGAIDEYQFHSITPRTHAHWPCLASFLPPTFCLYLLSYADRFILVFFLARSASNTPSRRPIPSLTSSCPSCSFRGCMPCTCRACARWTVQTADLDARPTTGGKHRDEHLLRVRNS